MASKKTKMGVRATKLFHSVPEPSGSARALEAKKLRDRATEVARLRPHALTRTNDEEIDYGPTFPANFTKGLCHGPNGLLEKGSDYTCFVEAINAPNPSFFDKDLLPVEITKFHCKIDGESPPWRGWESPRSGHVYDLEGPDAGSVGMSPAPRVGSSELAAEMAEVYSLALLRDVPFSVISQGGSTTEADCKPVVSADDVVGFLSSMPFYSLHDVQSSTPHQVDTSGLNRFERNRREARTGGMGNPLTHDNVFRGSTKGARTGPYVSQFLLVGNNSIAGKGGGAPSYPGKSAAFDLEDGFIAYGAQVIDQRIIVHKEYIDYMTDWASWLDVQNGANLKGTDEFEKERRFITTPRDLATYVHFDALYQAYLNACLILLGLGVPASRGFPEPSPTKVRDAFATFGGPHVLTLVTEVATRCLKAVRRQKFGYHRRARPEAIAGRLTLAKLGGGADLGNAEKAFAHALDELPAGLKDAIIEHNQNQNTVARTHLNCPPLFPNKVKAADFENCNLLLPMAFPEGSPMHPSYGAGHATVAGGCVTMVKAFFDMYEDHDSQVERILCEKDGTPICYEPTTNGKQLKKVSEKLTVQGELDKLAANISIGRNMAGVHYYSDYYDSLRMGERIAVGILLEQCMTYGEQVSMSFKSFDGDRIDISADGLSGPDLNILSASGVPLSTRDWWLRHVSGEQDHHDLF